MSRNIVQSSLVEVMLHNKNNVQTNEVKDLHIETYEKALTKLSNRFNKHSSHRFCQFFIA